MQQEQPGTVTHSHISSLLISRRLIRPRVASQYPVQTSSYFKQHASLLPVSGDERKWAWQLKKFSNLFQSGVFPWVSITVGLPR